MNWQLVKNVDPKPNQYVIVFERIGNLQIVEFAQRFIDDDGNDSVRVSTCFAKLVNAPHETDITTFEDFKEVYHDAYWSPFNKPAGE